MTIDIAAEAQQAVNAWLKYEEFTELTPGARETLIQFVINFATRVRAERAKFDEAIAASVAHEDPEFESEPILLIKGVELAGRKIERLIRKSYDVGVRAEWRSMDSAPKDGTRILINTDGDGIFIGFWSILNKCFCDNDSGIPFGRPPGFVGPVWIEATHWYPIPPPPETDA